MIFLYIIAERLHNLVWVALNLVQYSIRQNIPHSDYLVLCNPLFVNVIQILKLRNEVPARDVVKDNLALSVLNTLPISHLVRYWTMSWLIRIRPKLLERLRLFYFLNDSVELNILVLASTSASSIFSLAWNRDLALLAQVRLLLVKVDEYLSQEFIIHEVSYLLKYVSQVLLLMLD